MNGHRTDNQLWSMIVRIDDDWSEDTSFWIWKRFPAVTRRLPGMWTAARMPSLRSSMHGNIRSALGAAVSIPFDQLYPSLFIWDLYIYIYLRYVDIYIMYDTTLCEIYIMNLCMIVTSLHVHWLHANVDTQDIGWVNCRTISSESVWSPIFISYNLSISIYFCIYVE